MSGFRRVQTGGLIRTSTETPKISRGNTASREGHVIQGASGIVIGSGGEGSAGVSGTRSTATPLPHLYQELTNPTYKVELGHKVAETIRSDIAWTLANVGDVETGGWLLASARNPFYVTRATVPGADATATRSSVILGYEQLERAQRLHRDFALKGCWHFHPSGDDVPSDTDLRSFTRGTQVAGGRWISLICVPSRTWRPEPELSGWVTFQPGRPGVLITERLRLVT